MFLFFLSQFQIIKKKFNGYNKSVSNVLVSQRTLHSTHLFVQTILSTLLSMILLPFPPPFPSSLPPSSLQHKHQSRTIAHSTEARSSVARLMIAIASW